MKWTIVINLYFDGSQRGEKKRVCLFSSRYFSHNFTNNNKIIKSVSAPFSPCARLHFIGLSFWLKFTKISSANQFTHTKHFRWSVWDLHLYFHYIFYLLILSVSISHLKIWLDLIKSLIAAMDGMIYMNSWMP